MAAIAASVTDDAQAGGAERRAELPGSEARAAVEFHH